MTSTPHFKKATTRISSFRIKKVEGQPIASVEYEVKIRKPGQRELGWESFTIKSDEPNYAETVEALSKVSELESIIDWANKEFDRGLKSITRDSIAVQYTFDDEREVDAGIFGKVTAKADFVVEGNKNYTRIGASSNDHLNVLPCNFSAVQISNSEIRFDRKHRTRTHAYLLKRKSDSHVGFLEALRQGDKAQLKTMIKGASAWLKGRQLIGEDLATLRNSASLLFGDSKESLYDMAHHHIEVSDASEKLGRNR